MLKKTTVKLSFSNISRIQIGLDGDIPLYDLLVAFSATAQFDGEKISAPFWGKDRIIDARKYFKNIEVAKADKKTFQKSVEKFLPFFESNVNDFYDKLKKKNI